LQELGLFTLAGANKSRSFLRFLHFFLRGTAPVGPNIHIPLVPPSLPRKWWENYFGDRWRRQAQAPTPRRTRAILEGSGTCKLSKALICIELFGPTVKSHSKAQVAFPGPLTGTLFSE